MSERERDFEEERGKNWRSLAALEREKETRTRRVANKRKERERERNVSSSLLLLSPPAAAITSAAATKTAIRGSDGCPEEVAAAAAPLPPRWRSQQKKQCNNSSCATTAAATQRTAALPTPQLQQLLAPSRTRFVLPALLSLSLSRQNGTRAGGTIKKEKKQGRRRGLPKGIKERGARPCRSLALCRKAIDRLLCIQNRTLSRALFSKTQTAGTQLLTECSLMLEHARTRRSLNGGGRGGASICFFVFAARRRRSETLLLPLPL